MMLDFALAGLHHLLVFSLAGLLAVELAILRHGLSGAALQVLARIDGAYGGLAAAVLAVGVMRVVWGLKGWEYYAANHAFWAKMAAFALVGLLSIRPTTRIVAWRRQAAAEPAYLVPAAEIDAARAFLKAQALVFALILVFAAAMARGLG